MNQLNKALILLLAVAGFDSAHAALPIYADGDLGPIGATDGRVDVADLLIAGQIVTGDRTATPLELSHGDVYPFGAPDGAVNIQDLLLIQKLTLGQGAGNYVETLNLFLDGPATISVDVDGTNAMTDVVVGGWTGPGATVVNDPNFIDPEDSSNTIWHFSVSGGPANTYISTADLSNDPVLDSGFELSGMGFGQLVFDIKVNSISPGATLTVKIDSGYPTLGQAALSPSQYTVGSWRRVAIDFATLLSDPGPGPGLDVNNVVNAFVIEVTGGAADFYLDNVFITHACHAGDECQATVKTKPVFEFALIWSDEFDGTVLATENWGYEVGYGNWGWGNDEWQFYTSSPNNVSVANGYLEISAQCASPPSCGKRNGTITSGRINSLDKFEFKYGKVEARIKPPVGTGAWPAFWMLGANFPVVGWPNSGEIDVMEVHNLYSNGRTTHFTVHFCNDAVSSNPCVYPDGWEYFSQQLTLNDSLGDDFHVFSAEWHANGITGKIDGIPYFYTSIDPATMEEFLEEFFMILNVAIGGTLGGAPDASTQWPQSMLVDYVRVYEIVGGDGTWTVGGGPVSPTLGVYSESHTEATLPYSNIINGADFGGNVTNTNENSMAVPQFDGAVALEADFLNTGKTYGGFIFNFGSGRDISAYQTLKFAIDSSQMAGYADLEVKAEDADGGAEVGVLLSNCTPTLSGNWAVYEIPLSDFGGFDPTSMDLLGFWNARSVGGQLTFGKLYFDDIHFAGGQ